VLVAADVVAVIQQITSCTVFVSFGVYQQMNWPVIGVTWLPLMITCMQYK
jgi:hypothetical protein